ncbi:hypothetical protein [Streptomyces sp. CA2R106]|uniref:hypothetical protein n=1 Tax=Streptomyces sp. CA2R106 TaxID=3120153 RepID=UPI003009FB55
MHQGDRDATGELGRAPAVEWARLFSDAAQRRGLSGDGLALARAAREEIKQRARRTSALIDQVPGLPLTTEECSILEPPFGRSTHLPSPDRPYAHLAVHTGLGGVSVTPLWATAAGGNVVMSTVENRIKARATALDPMVALSVPAGIGSPLCYEVGGFVKQSPDPERTVIRALAALYSKPGISEHTDGNYTSWDRREGNERLRLEVLAYRVRNDLGDVPAFRTAPYIRRLAPRYGGTRPPRWSAANRHEDFRTLDARDTDGSAPYGAGDELAVLGVVRHSGHPGYRPLNATYGHLACFDRSGLLRCRQLGFDVIDVRGETRISFLVDRRDCEALRRSPAAALSVTKFRGGSTWLQSRGLVELHDGADDLRRAIRRLEDRYSRDHRRLALDLGAAERAPGDCVLATLSRQKVSSRYREAGRSLRSAGAR